ncbi:MAG: (deoxy)nucleoside triphosphate pyrophosphohydrolase [Nitrospiraceae bacterium]|nr:(deoxy)nucleoside triphosphate pyrophosphohydrolase [Nitrospiraceae bacterium]MDA8090810.1 (deoxy)nucleoside triphosphate pyrophosphohydrolase [Nitrospiraceae bacterium]
MKQKCLHVACAIVEKDGRVLAAQRGIAMSMPLKWEFPGGKIEHGESPEDCLRRELVEELGLKVNVSYALPPHTHSYDTFTVTLYPFVCTLGSGELTVHEHAAVAWFPPEELTVLDWAEADLPVIKTYLWESL